MNKKIKHKTAKLIDTDNRMVVVVGWVNCFCFSFNKLTFFFFFFKKDKSRCSLYYELKLGEDWKIGESFWFASEIMRLWTCMVAKKTERMDIRDVDKLCDLKIDILHWFICSWYFNHFLVLDRGTQQKVSTTVSALTKLSDQP